MNEEKYRRIVEKIQRLIYKDGIPLYKLAPQIGVSDTTLKRFLDCGGVTIFTVISIADYFKVDVFGKNDEKVD